MATTDPFAAAGETMAQAFLRVVIPALEGNPIGRTAAPAGKPSPLPRTFYNVAEVAKSMGLSRDAVYEAMGRGDIPEHRVGGRRLIPAKAFDEIVQQAK